MSTTDLVYNDYLDEIRNKLIRLGYLKPNEEVSREKLLAITKDIDELDYFWCVSTSNNPQFQILGENRKTYNAGLHDRAMQQYNEDYDSAIAELNKLRLTDYVGLISEDLKNTKARYSQTEKSDEFIELDDVSSSVETELPTLEPQRVSEEVVEESLSSTPVSKPAPFDLMGMFGSAVVEDDSSDDDFDDGFDDYDDGEEDFVDDSTDDVDGDFDDDFDDFDDYEDAEEFEDSEDDFSEDDFYEESEFDEDDPDGEFDDDFDDAEDFDDSEDDFSEDDFDEDLDEPDDDEFYEEDFSDDLDDSEEFSEDDFSEDDFSEDDFSEDDDEFEDEDDEDVDDDFDDDFDEPDEDDFEDEDDFGEAEDYDDTDDFGDDDFDDEVEPQKSKDLDFEGWSFEKRKPETPMSNPHLSQSTSQSPQSQPAQQPPKPKKPQGIEDKVALGIESLGKKMFRKLKEK